ncbi:MAG: hypothetical protein OXD50_01415 [Chloroflexi bacterium]|nr:hypothetical protein [Chloroflexota bacterium]
MTWSLALRNGFAWWLPILAAVVAALIAVIASQSSVVAWDADVHLWAREGRTPSEYAALVMERSVQESATSGMLASEDGLPELDGVAVNVTDTLIRVTVRASRQSDAEALALSLAHAAVDEAHVRYGDEAGLDLLGLVRPGARKVAPATGWTAAWASAIGLTAGLAFAWVFARQSSGPSTALGRLGRIGLKPLAVVSAEAEQIAGQAPQQSSGLTVSGTLERGLARDDAVLIANALNPLSGVIALTPLDDASAVTSTLIQAAQTLAARGNPVIWLDSRRPAFELSYSTPPNWLAGAPWSVVDRSEMILRAALRAVRPNGYVLLLTDSLEDDSTLNVAPAAAGVVLMARADVSEEELVRARLLLGSSRLLGVVLTQAQSLDLRDFEVAQMTE